MLTREQAEKAVRDILKQKLKEGMDLPKGIFKEAVEALLAEANTEQHGQTESH